MKQQLLRLRTLIAVMFSVLMSATFTACSDDDNDSPDATNIEGKWVCMETSDTDDGTYAFQVGESIRFNSNKTAVVTWNGDGDEDYKWNLKGNTLSIMEEDEQDDHYVGSISINGNEMTYTYKYRNWRGSSQSWEESETFVSKFKKP
ncbi:MAG: lipocalin family protein [Bacteroides sp.]|nr:lipocalin family protein [Bacteroides sp.]